MGRGRVARVPGVLAALAALAVWLPSALFSGALLALAAAHQPALPETSGGYTVLYPTPASPGYLGVVGSWDGQWYRSVAEHGYPVPLPERDGVVVMNAWAFYPLYPFAVRVVMTTGLGFAVSAWLVSIACSALAAVLLHGWLRRRLGTAASLGVVALLFANPAAAAFQVAYTESSALLGLVVVLRLLDAHRHWAATAAAVVLSLCRPTALPLALVFAVHAGLDLRQARRRDDVTWRSASGGAARAVVVAAAMGLWPLIAWVATGRRDAFVATQDAWPVNENLSGIVGGWLPEVLGGSPLGMLVLLAVLLATYVAVLRRGTGWDPGLRTWAAVYPWFLLLGSRPSPSVIRYASLAVAPLWPVAATVVATDRARRLLRWGSFGVLLVGSLVGQWFWVSQVFGVQAVPVDQLFP